MDLSGCQHRRVRPVIRSRLPPSIQFQVSREKPKPSQACQPLTIYWPAQVTININININNKASLLAVAQTRSHWQVKVPIVPLQTSPFASAPQTISPPPDCQLPLPTLPPRISSSQIHHPSITNHNTTPHHRELNSFGGNARIGFPTSLAVHRTCYRYILNRQTKPA